MITQSSYKSTLYYATNFTDQFTLHSNDLVKKIKDCNLYIEIDKILEKKKSLRNYHNNKQSTIDTSIVNSNPTYNDEYNNKMRYTKTKYLNKMYKYINKYKTMHFSHGYVVNKFMLIAYKKARELLRQIRNMDEELTQYITKNFSRQRQVNNTIYNLNLFINRYRYQKNNILHILYIKNIPLDIIKIIHNYIYIPISLQC
jgi:hypothetical protein